MVMMAHRVKRDIDRSRRKYGVAYKRYEKEVPYLFIPVRPPRAQHILPSSSDPLANNFSLVCLLGSGLCSVL